MPDADRMPRPEYQLLDLCPDPLLVVDRAWRIQRINPPAAALAQAPPVLPEGATLWEALPRLAGGEIERGVRAAAEAGGRHAFDVPHPRPGRWLRVTVAPANDDWCIILHDATEAHRSDERERADRERRALLRREQDARADAEAAQRQLTSILEGVGDAFFAVDSSWRITYMNRTAAAFLNTVPRELVGRMIWDQFPEIVGTEFERGYRKAMRERARIRFEECYAPLGIWCAVHAFPWSDGIAVQIQDVTERRAAEAARQESETRYRQLMEQSTDGIFLFDDEGLVVEVNGTACDMLGYRREDLVGRTLGDFVPPTELRSQPVDYAALRSGETVRRERMLVRSDGAVFPAEIHSRVVSPGLYQGIARDISERRRLEDQLRQAQKMEAVGRLAGGIAHDFNNLLTVIQTYGELVASEMDPGSPMRADVEEIRAAGARAAQLTRQLLAFSRKQVLQPRVLELNQIVTGLAPMLRRLIGEDIHVVTRLAPSLGRATADPGQLEQVVVNLVVNARDAMPGGGTLTIETSDVELDDRFARTHLGALPGPYVCLAVTDTGHGMSAEVRARVFEPFFTTKEPGKGTGLGLSTAYGIVKQSGGYIWCDSRPGRGTTFSIYLPRVVRSAAAEPVSAPAPAMPAGAHAGETVLLVEDEAPVRALVRRVLERRGFSVVEAAHGLDALRVVESRSHDIALVITDVVMPQLGGRTLVERLAALLPDVPVLYISGYTDDEIIRRGELASGSAFLQKPFTPDQLVRAVAGVLDGAAI